MQFCRLLFFAILLKVANSHVISNTNNIISRFTYEINNWIIQENNTNNCSNIAQENSEEFQQLIHNLSLPINLQNEDWRNFVGESSENICIICKTILSTFIKYRRQGMSEEYIRCLIIKICTLLKLQSAQVCDGIVTVNLPIILYIIDSKLNLEANTICGVLLESPSCPLNNDNEFNWIINIDNSPPKLIKSEESHETINIVQITDIHFDPYYELYGNSYCNEPTCCRKGQNNTNTSGKVAGYWGDYNCDSPWNTVVDALDHIAAEHQNISYIYFTGDIIDHGIWETTIKGNVKSLNKSYLRIHETFRNIPVYPILGNHEAHPVNQFAPTTITDANEMSTQWLYKMMADLWINFGWLPESTRSTILQGGFYTVSPKKGFRIIVLNDNICYCYNWWLWYQPQDPYNQLQWLADTLLQAEKDEEYVHILAHIPPGRTDCQTTWRREYIKIVNRFAHIISAQFNGHTHNDELQLYYSNDNNSKINNVAWNGGSLTTYQNLNSNYKLYTVDSKNYAVKDFENWIYNLTLANTNADQRPLWYKSYSFKEEYGISNLTYDSLHAWLHKLTSDEKLLNRYYRHYFKQAEPSLNKECDAKCMRSFICRTIVSLGDQKTNCDNYLDFDQI